jgi:hypothetical protein
MVHIVFALYPGITQLDFTGPYEVFSRLPGARVSVASLDGGALRTEHGLTFSGMERLADGRFVRSSRSMARYLIRVGLFATATSLPGVVLRLVSISHSRLPRKSRVQLSLRRFSCCWSMPQHLHSMRDGRRRRRLRFCTLSGNGQLRSRLREANACSCFRYGVCADRVCNHALHAFGVKRNLTNRQRST